MNNWEYIKTMVGGPLTNSDAEVLIPYAQSVPENGIILDIGTCEGKSAFTITEHCKPSVRVYTIDPTPNPRFYEHRAKLGFDNGKLEIFTSKSQDMKWDIMLDMFFNDGLHSHQGIVEDNKIYCPKVKQGGWCIYHDFTLYSNTVGKAISEDENIYYTRDQVIGNFFVGVKL